MVPDYADPNSYSRIDPCHPNPKPCTLRLIFGGLASEVPSVETAFGLGFKVRGLVLGRC